MMSESSAPEAPALQQPQAALLCENRRRLALVTPQVAARLRGLDLWAYLDAPVRAYHACAKKPGDACSVLIFTHRECGCPDDGVAVGLTDWRLAVDPAAPALLGIVVQDETHLRRRR